MYTHAHARGTDDSSRHRTGQTTAHGTKQDRRTDVRRTSHHDAEQPNEPRRPRPPLFIAPQSAAHSVHGCSRTPHSLLLRREKRDRAGGGEKREKRLGRDSPRRAVKLDLSASAEKRPPQNVAAAAANAGSVRRERGISVSRPSQPAPAPTSQQRPRHAGRVASAGSDPQRTGAAQVYEGMTTGSAAKTQQHHTRASRLPRPARPIKLQRGDFKRRPLHACPTLSPHQAVAGK